jgi:hypothetical protein
MALRVACSVVHQIGIAKLFSIKLSLEFFVMATLPGDEIPREEGGGCDRHVG